MMDYLADMSERIEEAEAELCYLRQKFYHIQKQAIIGMIRSPYEAAYVETYIDTHRDKSMEEAVIEAMTNMWENREK